MAQITQEARTAAPRSRGRISWRGRSFAWLGVLPFFLYVGAFLILPTLWLAVGAFQTDNGGYTLDYVRQLSQTQYKDAYWTSIRLSVVTALSGGIFGFFVAYAAVKEG